MTRQGDAGSAGESPEGGSAVPGRADGTGSGSRDGPGGGREAVRWWTRFLIVGAALSLVLLTFGPLSHRFGLLELGPSFLVVVSAVAVAAVALLGSMTMAVYAHRKDLSRNRNLSIVAMVVALAPIAVIAPQVIQGASVPAIHDITTDTEDPPRFDAIVEIRGDAPNPLSYGAGMESPEELARLQEEAYPEIESLRTELEAEEAVARAVEVLQAQGHEVVNREIESGVGIVEAVATTFWFGFRDDVVVRVRPADGGSVVDVRSVSRVGQSDLGKNAERIREFLETF
ncbi:MAG: DUF1499 domain-containing protein [Gemmatimonadota bacterium]